MLVTSTSLTNFRCSFAEFRLWMLRQDSARARCVDLPVTSSSYSPAAASSSSTYDPDEYDLDSGGTHPITMTEVQRMSGLEDQHVEDVFELFAAEATNEGYITKEGFYSAFAVLVRGRIDRVRPSIPHAYLRTLTMLHTRLTRYGEKWLRWVRVGRGRSLGCRWCYVGRFCG